MEFWKHSSNLHMSILYNYLYNLRLAGSLPRCLTVQFDNCARDNKNRWFFAFFGLLIHHGKIYFHLFLSPFSLSLGWFSSVEIYYLMPGHSHDMVDRECFAPVGHDFRKQASFWTPEDFPSFLNKAWQCRHHQPTIESHVAVCDWKSFLHDHLRVMRYHSHQRAFLMKKEGDRITFYYKASVLHIHWLGVAGKYCFFH